MLVRTGEARHSRADRYLAWSLAGIAGALNTAGFYAAGLYSSNMTGNVSAFADHLVLSDLRVATTYVALVITFISGAATSSLLINAGRRRQSASIYALSILAESVLLAGLAYADLWTTGVAHGRLLAYGLSFLMGLQNAVVTRISNARVRTTHVTGMVTDIGIELGNLLDVARHRGGLRGSDPHSAYDGEKLRLYGFTVLSFVAGGVCGVLAYKEYGPYFLFGTSLLLFGLALTGLLKGRATKSDQTLGPPSPDAPGPSHRLPSRQTTE